MILYALTCDRRHGFESWFPGSASFDAQARRGLVTCPVCGSTKVEKAIMAPAIARKDREAAAEPMDTAVAAGPGAQLPARPIAAPRLSAQHVPAEQVPAPMARLGDEGRALREMVRAIHRHVAENADDVGRDFAEEALKIHHGEVENRAIYGEASLDDARMLTEEGVAFTPLPILPEDRN